MTVLRALALCIAVFTASWWLTGRLRSYALARQLLDHPNPRSSHTVATPRGGGMAIVAAALAGLVIASAFGWLTPRHLWGLLSAGGLVAAVGFVDDHGHLRRRWRFFAHLGASAAILWAFGGLPPLALVGTVFDLGLAGQVLAVVAVGWLLNLTNFMDGIDGIAAVEAITVCLAGAALAALTGAGVAATVPPLVLAAAAMGFLVWNWPPARVFMGDAGSGFLGLMFAALSLQAGWTAPSLLWSWMILLGVFTVDATVTLVRRLLRGERIYNAHRTHAYQHAAQMWQSHLPVTLGVAALNLFWLLPIAALVAQGRLGGVPGVAIGYTPLIAVAFWFGAGAPARPSNRPATRNV